MPLVPFCVATVLGGAAWNLILLYAGYKLGENWHAVTDWVEAAKLPILGLAVLTVLGLAAWWYAKRKRALAPTPSPPRPPP